jgi:hypothetical protein
MYTGFFAKFGSTFLSEHMLGIKDSEIEAWLQPHLEQAVEEGKIAWICWPYSDVRQQSEVEQILDRFVEDLLSKRGIRLKARRYRPKPIRCDHRKDNRLGFLFVEAQPWP